MSATVISRPVHRPLSFERRPVVVTGVDDDTARAPSLKPVLLVAVLLLVAALAAAVTATPSGTRKPLSGVPSTVLVSATAHGNHNAELNLRSKQLPRSPRPRGG